MTNGKIVFFADSNLEVIDADGSHQKSLAPASRMTV
jgi:hypothetical protein